ncbi:hypothetical protein [Frankia tisae]|uniref:hypothetical protein n=1 Tax=Frankia tisae TaxID=2950104 RepID=UPI0021C15A0A|nr:hypothetical protein [Frankia tisae]
MAGTGKAGRRGDGGPALAAELDSPAGIAVASDGTVLIADCLNDRLRAVSPDGRIDTAHNQVIAFGAGGAVRVLASASGPVPVMDPRQVAVGPDGAVYVAQPSRHRIMIIPPPSAR